MPYIKSEKDYDTMYFKFIKNMVLLFLVVYITACQSTWDSLSEAVSPTPKCSDLVNEFSLDRDLAFEAVYGQRLSEDGVVIYVVDKLKHTARVLFVARSVLLIRHLSHAWRLKGLKLSWSNCTAIDGYVSAYAITTDIVD